MHRRAHRLARAAHRHVAVPLLRFVLPTPCFACGRPLERFQHQGACLACWCGFTPLPRPACPTCALPRPASTDLLGPAHGRCAACVCDPPPLAAVRAAVVYDDHARTFLLRAKLGGHRELLPRLGAQLAAALTPALATGRPAVVPVPSHPLMTLRRGFRPAAHLAREVAAGGGLPYAPGLVGVHWRARLVAKRQTALRRREARDVFRCRRSLPPGPILLVDDVMTTGGSLVACARALLAAGAPEVRALVWARTL